MELKDLFLTPIYLLLFYGIAFAVRKKVTNKFTKKYFIPALTAKFVGALGLGLIYQFYYGGGDTFNYFAHTKVVYQAFSDSASVGLKLIFGDNTKFDPELTRYIAQMYWYGSSTEYFVVRVAGFFAIFSFCTYAVIGLMFAALSFTGMWATYITFVRIFPLAYQKLALAVFFLPSVFFWGSGLMKDSLCVGALGWTFYGFYHATIEKKNILFAGVLGALGAYVLVSVKVYILLSFLPPALLWVFNENNQRIRSASVRMLLKPFFLVLGGATALLGTTKLTAGDDKYDVDKIGERTRINSTYLTSQVATGSAYNIGTFDGSIGSMVKVAPQAVVVSLFRPFLFEARNPVMLLSALEATLFLYLTIKLFYRTGILKSLKLIASQPILTFCFLFSIVLAVGVGTNSGNFGTLVRYKIPLMPFYLSALYIMQYKAAVPKKPKRPQLNRLRNTPRLAVTE
ncbi:hypothetical protein [Hymenobacter crusticola]|uniref:Glycosyltransferase RgtA/B/C/D-like domain-containing protein n=1 Tax=Hymenobacter crusticola TaxID=1770526 RepID=A0A243WE75_9BACT|nr:hypothetical protein [Hymenobacter crusticola]OUJ73167.1 hypothetical protein BXP70_15175 [Hymenobacter crusticola]